MNTPYTSFFQKRAIVKEKNKEEFSERTLDYYKLLKDEMIGKTEYESSENYLLSVLSYIEQNEFITDKQIEIVDRIYNHPEYDKFGYEVPF